MKWLNLEEKWPIDLLVQTLAKKLTQKPRLEYQQDSLCSPLPVDPFLAFLSLFQPFVFLSFFVFLHSLPPFFFLISFSSSLFLVIPLFFLLNFFSVLLRLFSLPPPAFSPLLAFYLSGLLGELATLYQTSLTLRMKQSKYEKFFLTEVV